MRKIIIIAAAFTALAVPAKAAVMLEMSQVTCKQYLESDPTTKAFIGNWMRGYFGATKNLSTVDFRYVKRNNEVVGKYCKSHKDMSLMTAIEKKAK